MNDKESLVYDLSIVKEASEDMEYLKMITEYFINNSEEMLCDLETAINTSDMESAQNIAHKLSSNFYMFGLKEGGEALSKMELNLLKKMNYNELPDLFLIAKHQGEKAIFQLKRDFQNQD